MFHMRSYVKDYEIREIMDKQGKMRKTTVYIGPWFLRTADEEMNKRLKRLYFTASFLLLFTYFTCGFFQNVGNRNIINALAYAFCCFPVIYNLIGMVATLRLQERATRSEYHMAIPRMKRSATAVLLLTIMAAVAEVTALIQSKGTISLLTEIGYFATLLISFLNAYFIRFLCKKYPYEIQEKRGENRTES